MNLDDGESSVENNFSIQSPATMIQGGVYWDVNLNGYYDAGVDELLSGVFLGLQQSGAVIQAKLTSANTLVAFTDLNEGMYVTTYVVPNGYLARGATSALVALSLGETKEVLFPVEQKTPYDLGIQKTVDKSLSKPGETLVYTLTITNLGNTIAGKNILVKDTLPLGLTYERDDGKFTSYWDTDTLVFTIPSLVAGASETITIYAHSASNLTSEATYTNTATLTSPHQIDENSSNNVASVTTTVRPADN